LSVVIDINWVCRGLFCVATTRNVGQDLATLTRVGDMSATCRRHNRLLRTSETLTWDPNSTRYQDQELAAETNNFGSLVSSVCSQQLVASACTLSLLITDLVDITEDDNLHLVLESLVMISSIDTSLAGQLRTRKTSPIDHLTLAARWMISPAQAEQRTDDKKYNAAVCVDMFEPHPCTEISDQ
jgi:hypothetical protein